MMKKLFGVLTGVLALNFLCAAGGVAYLVATHKLDKTKVHAIRDLIVGQPAPATQPTTQPATQPSPEDAPMLRLTALLDSVSHRPAEQQIDLTRTALDSQSATIERRLREVEDQRQQIEQSREELQKQQADLKSQRDQLQAEKDAQTKLATDEGFQKSLALYQAMAPKRTKEIFAGLDDDTVVRYLQAMDERQAASVLKEFKTPPDTKRAQVLLEKVRLAQVKAD